MSTPTLLNRICARPMLVSWIIGTCVMEAFVLAVLSNGVRLITVVSDREVQLHLLVAVPTAAGFGWFLGIFAYSLIGPICRRVNGAPLKPGDLVLVLAGPHRGTTTSVYEITTGQGSQPLARLDLGPKHRDTYTDIVEEYSVLKITGEQAA